MPPPPPSKKGLKPSVVPALGQQQPYPPSFPPPPLQQKFEPTPPPVPQHFKPPAVPQHFKPPAMSKHFKPPSLPMQELSSLPIQDLPAAIDIPSIVEAPEIPSVLPEAANVLSEVVKPPAVSKHFKPPAISKHFKPPSLPMQELSSLPIQDLPAAIDIPSIVEAPEIPSVLPEAANVLSEVALGITGELGAGLDGEEEPSPVTPKTCSDACDEEYERPSLDFDKFIKEESSTLTARKIKIVHKKLYEITKSISYNCLVMIVGCPFSILWGLLLGIISFAMNWVFIPFLKVVSWLLNATTPVLSPLRNCCKPFVELVAIICKR